MVTLDFSAYTHKKTKRKLEHLEDLPASVDFDAPVKKKKKKAKEEEFNLHPVNELMLSPKKKKKKKKKAKEEEFNLHPVNELMLSPKKKKKKKKKKAKEEEFNLLPVNELMLSPKKKKKKAKEEEFNLHPVNEETQSPEKKKKANKEEFNLRPVNELMLSPKKKKKAKEEEFNLHPVDQLTQSPEKKKKKKKKRRKLKCLEDHPVPVDINSPENKKKTRAAEEEFNLHPVDEPTQSPEKKKKKKTEKCVTDVTSQGEKKKKNKKNKNKQTSVTVATLNPNYKETVVSTETAANSTKEKKNYRGQQQKKNNKKTNMFSEEELKSRLGTEDWALVQELQEFIPNVKKRSPIEIRKLLRHDLARFKYFKQKGIPVRHGRFSREENQRIIMNVSDFLALTGISSASELFPQLSQVLSAETKKLKARHHFLMKLAEGIPRPSHQVYFRATKLLDNINQVGRFSQEEVESLRKLQHLHGNSWRVISEKMGRSSYSVAKRFCTLDSNHGPWTEEEELRLKQAVRDYLETLVQQGSPDSGLSRDQLCNNLPWRQISKEVQTRSWIQCRKKWFTILKYRLSSTGVVFNRGAEGCQAKICLINTLYDMSVEDPADIDWEEVARSVGKVTPICIQQAFHRLKCQKVPNWNRLFYDEIISYMKRHVVPYLHAKLESQTRWVERQVQYGEDRYDVNDIFNADETDNS